MSPSDAFDDADDLQARDVSDGDLASTLTSLLRADLCGTRPGAVVSALDEATKDRARLLLALADALRDSELVAWIEESPTLKQRAIALAKAVAPRDPGASHNAAAIACFRGYRAWQSAAYRMIIVPGYTPLDQREAKPGVHPVAQRRLEMAVEDHRAGKAPFLLVSGANVYPRGTPYYEAIEMKSALTAMGVPPERILVEARARHTTTNLRNAGRIMRQLGVAKALVITKGGGIGGSDVFGQDFYLANPGLSTFHGRCHRELGYQVGALRGVGDGRIEFEVSAHVDQPSYDPLDP
jgi:hypothetical protein